MITFNVVIGVVIVLALISVLVRAYGRAFLKFRGDRVITCPETHQPAGVRVDAVHAAFTAVEGNQGLRLKTCSRWPERQDCGQQCPSQIEASPESCLVRNILTNWYHGKKCALCGTPIGEINWADHKPALLDASQKTIQWQDLSPEQVPAVLKSHRPVCWNCHIVNSLITQHPELVVDRSRPF